MVATENEEHIIVITRRFPIQISTKKFQAHKYPIANVLAQKPIDGSKTKVDDPNIVAYKSQTSNSVMDMGMPLAYYWLRIAKIIPDEYLKKKCSSFKLSYFSGYDKVKDYTLENIISSTWITMIKQSFVDFLLRDFHSNNLVKFDNLDFFSCIHQLKSNDGSHSNIFIYNHFPDKQNVNYKTRPQFLASLRSDVSRIINANNLSMKKYQFNWLVHDTDILDESYDGPLWFNKVSMHPRYETSFFSDRIPESMKKDNIWCFIHEPAIDSYYKKILQKLPPIQTPYESPFKSALDIYKFLTIDNDSVRDRIEILKKIGVNLNELSFQDLQFIFDVRFDDLSSLSEYLDNLEQIIGIKKDQLIKTENGKYNIQEIINWLNIPK